VTRRPRVVVLDYGSGNVRSAQRALQRAGADAEVTADADAAREADGLVVPGVGAFAACMAGLLGVAGDQVIAKRLAGARPVLGICVGMQVLFEAGVEHGLRTAGCGCWPGVVERLTAPVLPHMGWNSVRAPADSILFAGLGPEQMFYFVHSYALRAPVGGGAGGSGGSGEAGTAGGGPRVTWATHGEPFVAALEDGPLSATQFHPEKSGDAGAQVLANWLTVL
jgi:glutamine amidotransferase